MVRLALVRNSDSLLKDEILIAVSSKCPNITQLNLSGCIVLALPRAIILTTTQGISEVGIREICDNLSELKKLTLRECWNILDIRGTDYGSVTRES